jgi:tRNA (guanine-N7-)-methyltransferase
MSRDMSVPDQEQQRRPASFFGRRKGHRLRRHQAELVDQALPKLALDLATPAPQPLAGLFPGKADSVRLEIGFGGGEHLLAEAHANPDMGFIGCEPYLNGLAKVLARLFAGDAVELLAWLPAASLQRIDLIHPDPWPKRRHWKRRFVQPATVASMARVLQRGGEFRFVSDIDDYAAWTLDLLRHAPVFVWSAERADDWRKPWPGFTHTRYGAKAVREGRAATYLIFRRR